MAIFLNKAHAALKTITKGDAGDVLGNLHVTSEYVEASNGHILLRVPLAPTPSQDFPVDEKTGGEEIDATGILLDPAAVEKALKHTDKIFPAIHISQKEGRPILQATDYDNHVTIKDRQATESRPYPDTEQVIPKDSPYVVTLEGQELRRIVDWACKHATVEGKDTDSLLHFYISENDRPVKIEMSGGSFESFKPFAVIMPYRAEERKKEQRAKDKLKQWAEEEAREKKEQERQQKELLEQAAALGRACRDFSYTEEKQAA